MKITTYFCDKCEKEKLEKELTKIVLDLSTPNSVEPFYHTKLEICKDCQLELVQVLTKTIEDYFKTNRKK